MTMKRFVVLPTYREAQSLSSLLIRLAPFQVIVVDDETDEQTMEVVSKFGNVTLISRPRKQGLVSAVIVGMQEAVRRGADYVAVMDADGQHDPAYLEEMFTFAEQNHHDLVLGSRYIKDRRAGIVGLPLIRRIISRGANLLFSMSFGPRVKDATTGYRIYSRAACEYLIANRPRHGSYTGQVEIVDKVYSAGMSIAEYPIMFYARREGQSKLRLRDIISFYIFAITHGNLWKYLVVGASGVVVSELVLYALSLHINYIAAEVLAIEVSIVSNFILNDRWTFSNRRLKRTVKNVVLRFFQHNGASLLASAINFAVFMLLALVGINILLSNFVGINAAFAFRYVVSAQFIWSGH
ncbi:glycosyltransferase [Thermogymnomonas acidicola]|nr:glycosyltransferase [Thermogymnomonas acidicola]